MTSSVISLLNTHLLVIGIILVGFFAILVYRKLFNWTSSGFWAWVSFALYFFLNPLFSKSSNNFSLYQKALSLSGGIDRGYWITIVATTGIMVFFASYFLTRYKKVDWGIKSNKISPPALFVLFLFSIFGIYSLLSQRANIIDVGREAVVVGGQFTGDVSGYENAGYAFLFLPIIMLLISKKKLTRVIGWTAAAGFIFLALPSGWSRFVLVSMLITLSLTDTLRRNSTWPRWFFMAAIIIFAIALQLRGHTKWDIKDVGSQLTSLAGQSLQNVEGAIGSSEVSAIATWYVESYVYDQYYGYSYGLPVINYVLTGWIPSRIFPQKYFLIDYLKAQRPALDPAVYQMLYGAKSTLLGSFYGEGGIIGVILLAALFGFVCRRIDGMLDRNSPNIVKATGIAFMSVLWMVWQSSDTWGVMLFGVLALPSIFVWLVTPRVRKKSNKSSPENIGYVVRRSNS